MYVRYDGNQFVEQGQDGEFKLEIEGNRGRGHWSDLLDGF